jgi:hypothetical protein
MGKIGVLNRIVCNILAIIEEKIIRTVADDEIECVSGQTIAVYHSVANLNAVNMDKAVG